VTSRNHSPSRTSGRTRAPIEKSVSSPRASWRTKTHAVQRMIPRVTMPVSGATLSTHPGRAGLGGENSAPQWGQIQLATSKWPLHLGQMRVVMSAEARERNARAPSYFAGSRFRSKTSSVAGFSPYPYP
jgi:hypothetical protein